MKEADMFQVYEVAWSDFTNALRNEMKKQIGADIIDRIVCDMRDGFEVYTYIQGDLDFERKEMLERKYGTDAAFPNILTILLLAGIYQVSEANIRLHADHIEQPVVEVYIKK